MTCQTHARRGRIVAAALTAMVALEPRSARGQHVPSPRAAAVSGARAVHSPHRPPVIALVRPLDGGTVPPDRPVAVLEYAPGAADDAIDARSLRVAVDCEDRTALFTASGAEAEGLLSLSSAPLTSGAHHVAAHICTTAGGCATARATVFVDAPPAPATGAQPALDRRRLLQLAAQAVKHLLIP